MDLLLVWDNNWVWTQLHLETSGADFGWRHSLAHDFCGCIRRLAWRLAFIHSHVEMKQTVAPLSIFVKDLVSPL